MQLICVKSNQIRRKSFLIAGYTLAPQSTKVIAATATRGTEEKETSHKGVLAGTLLLISFVRACVRACVLVCGHVHAPFLTHIQLK